MKKKFSRPTANEVFEYGVSIGYRINGEKFLAHYDATDWMRGRTKIMDWRRCVVTWKIRAEENNEKSIFTPIPKESDEDRKKRLLDLKLCIYCRPPGKLEFDEERKRWSCRHCGADHSRHYETGKL